MKRLMYLMLLVLPACSPREEAPASSSSDSTVKKTIVDSIFPVEEEIRRFKAARNNVSASALNGGATSRDELVMRVIKAVETKDAAELSRLVMNAGEFIDLYYPSSNYSHAPYKQSPEVFWLLLQENSQKGINRALQRFGGKPLNYQTYSCSDKPLVQDRNRFWSDCQVRWNPGPDAPNPFGLFGPIMERDGKFKFVSYANDL